MELCSIFAFKTNSQLVLLLYIGKVINSDQVSFLNNLINTSLSKKIPKYQEMEEYYLDYLIEYSPKQFEKINLFNETLAENEIKELLVIGETTKIEFKSSLMFDLREKINHKRIDFSSLKTIAAFLNSGGGSLLNGVEDNKNIIGIDLDGFANEDKYLLHIAHLLNEKFHTNIISLVDTRIVNFQGKNICLI